MKHITLLCICIVYIHKDFPNPYIQDSKQSYMLLENEKLILSNPKIYFHMHCDKMLGKQ